MIHRHRRQKCYPQVKTGNVPLNGNAFAHLTKAGGEVYLFTACERYDNTEYPNIHILTRRELLEFMQRQEQILPERIRLWALGMHTLKQYM